MMPLWTTLVSSAIEVNPAECLENTATKVYRNGEGRAQGIETQPATSRMNAYPHVYVENDELLQQPIG
jgi:hypothetical protein